MDRFQLKSATVGVQQEEGSGKEVAITLPAGGRDYNN